MLYSYLPSSLLSPVGSAHTVSQAQCIYICLVGLGHFLSFGLSLFFFSTDLCFVYILWAVTLVLQIFYSVVCLLPEVVSFNKVPIFSYPEVMNLVLNAVLVKHTVWRAGQPSISVWRAGQPATNESRNNVELLRSSCCRMLDR